MGWSNTEPGVWQKTVLSFPCGENRLRSLWQPLIHFNWTFGLALVLLVGIPRFVLMLQANSSQEYPLVPLLFILMAATPFLFLTRPGRKQIRLRPPVNG